MEELEEINPNSSPCFEKRITMTQVRPKPLQLAELHIPVR
jgi:hypothetical protein